MNKQSSTRRLWCVPCAIVLALAGCFSTVTRTRVPEGSGTRSPASWSRPLDPDIRAVFERPTGDIVIGVIATYRAEQGQPVEGFVEECSTISGASLLAGEILAGIGAALGGSLLGVGLWNVSADCADAGCLAEGVGMTASGAAVLAASASFLGASIAIDAAYEADEPYDCVESGRVQVNLPPPPDERREVGGYLAVAPGVDPEAPVLVPADDLGRVALPADAYLGCPARCTVPSNLEESLALRPDIRAFFEEVTIEVPLLLAAADGSPGEPIGSARVRVPCVRFADMVEALAGREAAAAPADGYVSVRAVVEDADGGPQTGTTVRLQRRPSGADTDPAAGKSWLAIAPEGEELYRAAFRQAAGERWREGGGEGTIAATGEGAATSGADGSVTFLVLPGSSADLVAELPDGSQATGSVELPALGGTSVEVRLAPAAAP